VLAQVPGFANVPVYLNGQLAAHTDREGNAILPGLPSYQKSRITIDTKDLPIEAQIERSEAYATPHYRSGVSLKFSVQLSIGALVRFVAENGQPLPNGTVITIEGSTDEFQVALLGEAYLTGLAKKSRIKASWNNQHCDIEINLPENPGPLPHIGPLLCKGIQP
jgi:outer membrane usher protein